MKLPTVSSRNVLVAGLVLFACGILVLVSWFIVSRPKKFLEITQVQPQKSTVDLGKTIVWEDPLGFTFEYPENVILDKHDEDLENYAHVELTSPDYKGSVIVWVQDLPPEGIDWIEEAKGEKGVALDTMFGSEPAKKILTTTGTIIVTTGMLYDDLLFKVEGSLEDQDYWEAVYTKVIDSFVLYPIPGSENVSSDDDSGFYEGVVDEEEVIE